MDSGLDRLVGALADAGFGQIGLMQLGNAAGLATVRAIVPGLGSLTRRRMVSNNG